MKIENFITNFKNQNPNTNFLYFTEFGIKPAPSFQTWNAILKPSEKNFKEMDFKMRPEKKNILFLGTRFMETHSSWKKLINNNDKDKHYSLKFIDAVEGINVFQIINLNENNIF